VSATLLHLARTTEQTSSLVIVQVNAKSHSCHIYQWSRTVCILPYKLLSALVLTASTSRPELRDSHRFLSGCFNNVFLDKMEKYQWNTTTHQHDALVRGSLPVRGLRGQDGMLPLQLHHHKASVRVCTTQPSARWVTLPVRCGACCC